jgi:hypothetical protein
MTIRSIVATLAVLFVASASSAQPPVSWQAFAERVGPKSLVAVELINGRRVEGHIVQVTGTAVSVLPKTRIPVPVRQLALADIQSIEVEREGWSPGAKVLAGVGTVAGILATIAIMMLAGSR